MARAQEDASVVFNCFSNPKSQSLPCSPSKQHAQAYRNNTLVPDTNYCLSYFYFCEKIPCEFSWSVLPPEIMLMPMACDSTRNRVEVHDPCASVCKGEGSYFCCDIYDTRLTLKNERHRNASVTTSLSNPSPPKKQSRQEAIEETLKFL